MHPCLNPGVCGWCDTCPLHVESPPAMHTLHMYTWEQAHRLPKHEYPFDVRKGHILS